MSIVGQLWNLWLRGETTPFTQLHQAQFIWLGFTILVILISSFIPFFCEDGKAILVEYTTACFPRVFFPCLWPRKVSEVAALFTKQRSLEKHTNSGVSLYSGGIVSSRSPAFFSFFSLAFAWKKKRTKKRTKILFSEMKNHNSLNITIKIAQPNV